MARYWYVLYTKPNQEHQVSRFLSARGLETYLPEVPVLSRQGKPVGRAPFFPCYLFAHFDPLEQAAVAVPWTPGLRYLVSFGQVPARVDERLIARLQERLGGEQGLEFARGGLKHGDPVRVVDGPFRDFDAVFDSHLSSGERVRILLQVLGRSVRVEIDARSIVKR